MLVLYLFADATYNDLHDEGDDDDFEVVMVDNSRYSTTLHVSKYVHTYKILVKV